MFVYTAIVVCIMKVIPIKASCGFKSAIETLASTYLELGIKLEIIEQVEPNLSIDKRFIKLTRLIESI